MLQSRLIITCFAVLIASFSAKSVAEELRALSTFMHLNEPIYIAAVYTEQPASDPDGWLNSPGKRSMELRFIPARLSSRMFARVFLERVLVNNAPEDVGQYQVELQQILTFIRQDYRRGDRIQFDAPSGGPLTMKVNGSVVAEIQRPGFFNLLLKGWIGEKLKLQTFYRDLVSPVDAALKREFDELAIADGREAWAQEMIGNKPSLSKQQVAEEPKPKPQQEKKPEPKPVVKATPPKPKPKPVVSKPVEKPKPKPEPKPVEQVAETKKPVAEPKVEQPPKQNQAAVAALNPLLQDLKDDYLVELKNAIENKATPRPPRTLRKVSRDDLIAIVTVNREAQVTTVDYRGADFPEALKEAVTQELKRLTTLPTPPEVLVDQTYTVETTFNFGKCKRPAANWICF